MNILDKWRKKFSGRHFVLRNRFLCQQHGFEKGCSRECPVYEAEECPNQLSNEKFFNWLENLKKWEN